MNMDNGSEMRIWSMLADATAKEPTWTHIQNHTNRKEKITNEKSELSAAWNSSSCINCEFQSTPVWKSTSELGPS